MTERQALGRMGEDAAARLYTDAGYRVIERNRHESHNEIDLILENATSLVFVEVKTRTQSPGTRPRFGRPASAVDAGKRKRTVLAAEAYLREHPTAHRRGGGLCRESARRDADRPVRSSLPQCLWRREMSSLLLLIFTIKTG